MKTKLISMLLALLVWAPISAAAATKYTVRTSPPAAPSCDARRAIVYAVPFVSQAPTGNWADAVFKDACEETSALMAMSWVSGQSAIDSRAAEAELHAIAAWEVGLWGFHQDTSATDTARIFSDYYHFSAEAEYDIGTNDIIQALEEKSIVLVPINGQSFYSSRGPVRHMILVTGYDYQSQQFIVQDPVQRSGNVRVDSATLAVSLRDYPSGVHLSVPADARSAMIKVRWPWLSDPAQ